MIHASVPPSTLIAVDPLIREELAGPVAASAGLADHVGRSVSGKDVECVGHGSQGHEHRTWHMTSLVLVWLADIDQHGPGLQRRFELVD